MFGAVGDDQFGADTLKQLQKENIHHGGVRSAAGQKTGTTIILVEEGSGENRILFIPGANYSITLNHIGLNPSWKDNLVLFQFELPFRVVILGLEKAKSMGKVTMLNPAPATPIPESAYKNLDHLIVNESEASILSGIPEQDLTKQPDKVADHFINLGVKFVVITLGSKGVFWKLSTEIGSGGNFLRAHTVRAIDTTAAGDTFVGALAAQLAASNPLPSSSDMLAAIKYANYAASISVQRAGAQASIPYRSECW